MSDPRLQQHCDTLNAMGWVRASGQPYIVYTDPETRKQSVIRYGEKLKKDGVS